MSDLTVANLALGGLLGGLGLALLMVEARDWRRRRADRRSAPSVPIDDILLVLRSERSAQLEAAVPLWETGLFDHLAAVSRIAPVTDEEFNAEVERGMDAIGRYLAARAGQV